MATKRPGSVTRKAVVPSNHWYVRLLDKNNNYTGYSWIVCVPVEFQGQKSWEAALSKIKKEGLLPTSCIDERSHNLLPAGYTLVPELVEWEGSDHMVARLF